MTDKQIRAEKAARLLLHPSTVENERCLRELWCRQMINAVLAYGDESDLESGNYFDVYLARYKHTLGAETYMRLCMEQIRDFEAAEVFRDVDESGCAFVSVTWSDESGCVE